MTDRRHPSLLNRISRRLAGLGQKAREGVQLVQDEARHPGEPLPARRSRDPLHRTADDRAADAATPSAVYRPGGDTTVDPLAPPDTDPTAGADPWYLQGKDEGWSDTNPTAKDDKAD